MAGFLQDLTSINVRSWPTELSEEFRYFQPASVTINELANTKSQTSPAPAGGYTLNQWYSCKTGYHLPLMNLLQPRLSLTKNDTSSIQIVR